MSVVSVQSSIIFLHQNLLHSQHDAELAFMEIRHSYSTFPLKTAVPYPTNGSVPDLVID